MYVCRNINIYAILLLRQYLFIYHIYIQLELSENMQQEEESKLLEGTKYIVFFIVFFFLLWQTFSNFLKLFKT